MCNRVVVRVASARLLEDGIMEPHLSNTARRSFPTGYARLAVVLACLLASGFLPPSATGAQAALPLESQAPCDDGQEPEVVKSGTARTIAPPQSHHPAALLAPTFDPTRRPATGPLDYRSHPPGRPARPHALRC